VVLGSTVVLLAVTYLAAVATGETGRLVGGKPCARVFWRSLRDRDQRCPRSHSLLSDVYWSRVHWTAWTERQALGYGYQVHQNGQCGGDPIVCHDALNPIDIRLSQPKACPSGAVIWSRIDVIEKASSGRALGKAGWTYTCTPSVPSRGLGGGGG